MKQVGLILSMVFLGLWTLSGCDSNAGSQANDEETIETPSTEVEVPAVDDAENASMASTADAASLPKFEFEEMNHDFGTITEGEVVEHTFTFTNVGEAPLVIQNTSASCGCTTPSYSREPVAPGETGEVQVRFNSQNQVGMKNKTVNITANTDPAVTRLSIKMSVIPEEETQGPVRK